jgi:hypothetical protein
MKIENPKVTLADDARIGVNPEARSGFLDWLMSFSVTGDDGELYNVGGSILSMDREQLDLVSVNMSKGKGYAQQLPGSIYKICRYPGMSVERLFRNPKGTLKIEHKEHSILVTCGPQYQLECFEDNTWHLQVNSGDDIYSADLWHRPQGYPLWYGREKPSFLTQHSVTYGYNWAGAVDGEIVYEGKKICVSGLGIRERYVAVDSSAAELGAWEDWGFISFNEVHASMYDMRAGMKDFSVYDLKTNKHYPEGKLTITHEDWAFFRELDGFVPTTYRVKIEVDDGVYDMEAHVVNGTTWGVTYKVPDNPVATLTYGQVTGTFTTKEGSVRTLTGGRGTMSIRQWHAYPNILPRELYSDEVLKGEKFETL